MADSPAKQQTTLSLITTLGYCMDKVDEGTLDAALCILSDADLLTMASLFTRSKRQVEGALAKRHSFSVSGEADYEVIMNYYDR